MDFKEFISEVKKGLQERLGGGAVFKEIQIDGLNGVEKNSLIISRQGANISPCINMGDYFNRYMEGMEIGEGIREIAERCRRNPGINEGDAFRFTDWDYIRTHIFGMLVNTEKNTQMLQDVPNRPFLDLSMVYYARIGGGGRNNCGIIKIRNEHMRYWGAREEDLFRESQKNMRDAKETVFRSLYDILHPLIGLEEGGSGDEPCGGIPMYLLGSRYGINGAVQMCSPEALREAAASIGDDLWVLPSSIHEVILIPYSTYKDGAQELSDIVREINATQVSAEETLSNHAYHYSRESGQLTIGA